MPTLTWTGKNKVINHHQAVPLRILEHEYGFTAENGRQTPEIHSGNMIIHGDKIAPYNPSDDNRYYLGQYNGTAYYFIYEPDQITTLNYNILPIIKDKAEQYIIYADNCLLSDDFMKKYNITFKKIPRDITRL